MHRLRLAIGQLLSAQRLPSLARHCALAFPAALLPTLALLAAASAAALGAGLDMQAIAAPPREATAGQVLGAVVWGPVVETLMLASLMGVLSALTPRRRRAAAASALIWGALHGLFGALWFFGTAWSFYVYSISYLAWRPVSFARACVAAWAPHMLINLCAMAAVWIAPG